ncbi:hypothetical protein L227DRAFT_101234 [Lentinus tigrinus ALCF2SS1-6]|uniref:Uncharacterized protein n=1 Tax=Lentinus tigrinus ALCF2SS1-6 TaxID=1328759 RepID=A0A5C2S974_9APHY|nr:hypothetical protein L227DRAFT_101234 [Lentinus tigrinus ALCF2SS1-6]
MFMLRQAPASPWNCMPPPGRPLASPIICRSLGHCVSPRCGHGGGQGTMWTLFGLVGAVRAYATRLTWGVLRQQGSTLAAGDAYTTAHELGEEVEGEGEEWSQEDRTTEAPSSKPSVTTRRTRGCSGQS